MSILINSSGTWKDADTSGGGTLTSTGTRKISAAFLLNDVASPKFARMVCSFSPAMPDTHYYVDIADVKGMRLYSISYKTTSSFYLDFLYDGNNPMSSSSTISYTVHHLG